MDKTKEVIGILELFRDHIERQTGLKALLEPQQVKLLEPHLKVMAPTGWEFQSEGLTQNAAAKLYTARLGVLVTLTAYGDGPDFYLVECMSASFRLGRYFHDPVSIPVVSLEKNVSGVLWHSPKAGHVSARGIRRPGGQHFRNESDGSGEKPFLYEESYDVHIYFPYAELT